MAMIRAGPREALMAALLVLALAAGLGVGYIVWGTRVKQLEESQLRQSLETERRLQELRNRLADVEKKAERALAAERVAQETLQKANVLK